MDVVTKQITTVSATEDMKRKMYNCILVVGGGMKFNGIATYLQNRLHLQVPFAYRTGNFQKYSLCFHNLC